MDNQKKDKVLAAMKEQKISQMMITDPESVFYLTGRWILPGERFLGLYLSEEKEPVLFLNELFSFEEEIGARKVYYSDTDDLVPIWKTVVDPGKILGVDKTMASKFLLSMMEGQVAKGYVNGSVSVDDARAVKTKEEQEKMRIASKMNDAAMERFKGLVREGVTELEIAEQMLGIYKSLGASGYSFDPIVGFGKNAADPHHMPDNTVLQEGDCVLFDVGCKVNDYCSDMTRTFFYKKDPTPEERRVYELTLSANTGAEAYLKAGVELASVDKKARDIITQGGYGPQFTHRLGHFIGIGVHEAGDVSAANHNLTKAGNIFSIEPGIYVTGKVGVRIEDLVLVTEDGCEVLNHYPKDLQVIG